MTSPCASKRRAQASIGDIGVDFARIDGKIAPAAFLPALDFGVPIGAFNKPHMETAIMGFGERGKRSIVAGARLS